MKKIITRIASALGFERRTYDTFWQQFEALRTGAVTPATAESISSVYAAVDSIASTIASLPLFLFRRTEDGREKADGHPLYRVLHDQPNPRQTALEFRETMTAHMLLRGNAYAKVIRGHDGQVRELWPLHPDRVRVIELPNDRIAYEHTTRDGQVQRLTEDDVFVLRHRSDDGITGVSPIARARGVIELAAAEQQHGVSTFENGAKLLGVLKTPATISREQQMKLTESWKAFKAGSTPILPADLDYKPISMTLEDAEWIAARQFSVEEIARLFRVPPVLIGDLRHANYSNSVEMNRWFLTHGLRRHLVAWEQGIHRQLLSEAGRRSYFVEHSVEGMLRGDSTTRAGFYKSGIEAGWLTVDEVRDLENLPRRQTA